MNDPFLPLFRGYLTASLGRNPTIFLDREIATGDAWPERLKNALASARCLVAIWSPNYFISNWCRCECQFVMHRERVFNFRTVEKPDGLIVPVTVHDGERFPPYAKAIQYADWVRFARVGEGFKKTERFVDFQDEMSDWAADVAKAINSAPNWDPAWLTRGWLDEAIPEWNVPAPEDLATEFSAPQLI